MNILFVSNGYPPTAYGGVEVYVYQLANYLVKQNHQVTVFCRESADNLPDYERIEDNINGVKIVRVVNDFKNTSSFTNTFQDDRIERLFSETLQEASPDIVHINHLISLSFRIPLLVDQAGIPSINSLHDYWSFCFRVRLVDWKNDHCPGQMNGGDCIQCIPGGSGGFKHRMLRLVKSTIPYEWRQEIRRRIIKKSSTSLLTDLSRDSLNHRYESYKNAILSANRILTPSKYIRHQYSLNGYPEDRFEVVRLGIDIPSNKSISVKQLDKSSFKDGLRFLFVGTMIPDKGLDILLRAFKKLESKNVSLIIYGRDDIVPTYYKDLLRDLSNGDERIVFKGPFNQDERNKVYANCDVVVIPSRFPETFSLVAHEAFVYGKPVLASDIGALPEVVINGQNGFLVPPGDDQSLLSVMERMIRNPENLSGLDIPGPINVYSVADHVEYLKSIYLEEINSR